MPKVQKERLLVGCPATREGMAPGRCRLHVNRPRNRPRSPALQRRQKRRARAAHGAAPTAPALRCRPPEHRTGIAASRHRGIEASRRRLRRLRKLTARLQDEDRLHISSDEGDTARDGHAATRAEREPKRAKRSEHASLASPTPCGAEAGLREHKPKN